MLQNRDETIWIYSEWEIESFTKNYNLTEKILLKNLFDDNIFHVQETHKEKQTLKNREDVSNLWTYWTTKP